MSIPPTPPAPDPPPRTPNASVFPHSQKKAALTAFRSAAGPSLAAASTFLLPTTSILGIGGPQGDLASLLTIAGSPAYAMVGAAAVLSALYRAPLTGSLLLFELTKVSSLVGDRVRGWGIVRLLYVFVRFGG